jgi:Zn-dependent protease with chaperone function
MGGRAARRVFSDLRSLIALLMLLVPVAFETTGCSEAGRAQEQLCRQVFREAATVAVDRNEFPAGADIVASIREATPTGEGAQLLRANAVSDLSVADAVRQYGVPDAVEFRATTQKYEPGVPTVKALWFGMFYKSPPRTLVFRRPFDPNPFCAPVHGELVLNLNQLPRTVGRLTFAEPPMAPPWPVTVSANLSDFYGTPAIPAAPPSIVDGKEYEPAADYLRAHVAEVRPGHPLKRASDAFAKLNKVAETSGIEWKLIVLANPEPIGFGVPDGSLFVSDGLIASLSDPELAAVVAHVMAHERYQHARDVASTWASSEAGTRTDWQAAASSALALIGRVAPSGGNEAPPLGSLYLGRLAMDGYSREQETEANFLAAKYLRQIGLPPDALFDAMASLSTKGGGNKSMRFADLHRATQSAADFGKMLDAGLIK